MTPTPTPKYAIGDTVFRARCDERKTTLPCPDCLGTGKWKATSPGGTEVDMDCPRCKRDNYEASLSLQAWTFHPRTECLTIGRVSTEANRDGSTHVQYMCVETGVGSGSVYREELLHATEPEAREAAEAECAAKQAEYDARPPISEAKARASMGYFSAMESGLRQHAREDILSRLNDEYPSVAGCSPGRWLQSISTDDAGLVSWDVRSHNGIAICSGYGRLSPNFPSNDEGIANARLIAAAPALLEALKDAISGLRYIRHAHGELYGVGWDRVEASASAAISSAEGGGE